MKVDLDGIQAVRGARVVVVGAGAFGGWAALRLARAGARVTLLDAWGPGNARASSGGDTRVMRATYGTRTLYTRLATRALALWREHDRRFHGDLFTPTGALWLFEGDDAFGRASAGALAAEGLPFEWLSPAEASARYPQLAYDAVSSVLVEPGAGYLHARRACAHVAARVAAEGGTVRAAAVAAPVRMDGQRLRAVALTGGGTLEADLFLFACGPWLGELFPDVIGERVAPTRQEVYYFGTPAGDTRFSDGELPVWLDMGERIFYGIPGNAHRGFKLADDTSGAPFDPTHGSRDLTPDGIDRARAFLARRFPALAGAPLIDGEVCQYEASPDAHFILDRHPGADNVWIAGGGSGHGFKMGPAMGEVIAEAMFGGIVPDEWRLGRFARPAAMPEKWS